MAISNVSTLLRFATAGSVDDGKSTLVGRLLHDSKAILADQLESITRTSRERGFGGADSQAVDLALLTDGLRAEREQGITIDVAYRYFATERRSFILADCPGHEQYTKNTVTGASTADAVVVLVDARKGILEQTRRHLAVARLLRVAHVIIAVNKIDLVDFQEPVFREIEHAAHELAAQLGLPGLSIIPVSALEGDNVVERSARTPWYQGAPLLALLESLPSDDAVAAPTHFRMPVQVVIRPQGALAPGVDPEEFRDFRGYAGQVSSGRISLGEQVVVLPSGQTAHVTGLDGPGGELEYASAGDSVVVRLDKELDISRGDQLVSGDVPTLRQDFEAQISWLAPEALRPGARVLLKHGAATVQALVQDIAGRLDLTSLSEQEADELALNDIGRVRLRVARELPIEAYEVDKRSGAFLLIDKQDGNTLAAGMAV